MTNLELLNEFIKRSGLKINYIAEQLGITRVALHGKLNGKTSFTLKEALKIKEILHLAQNEWEAVFNETV